MKSLSVTRTRMVAVLGVFVSVFFLYTAVNGIYPAIVQRAAILGPCLAIAFLLNPWNKEDSRVSYFVVDAVFAALGVGTSLYFILIQNRLFTTGGALTTTDIVVSFVLLILVLEGARRTIGWILSAIAIVFIFYSWLGDAIPGAWGHAPIPFEYVVANVTASTEGIWGLPLGVTATIIGMFILYGALLQRSGAGQFFIDLAQALFGYVRGGPAKVAVIASSLFGTISGSAVANVTGTGTITIPLMKKVGYEPSFAGAVEAVSSTGGQIMPPVMGAAAFIIADFLGISYVRVLLGALIPAIIYYGGLFVMVDLEAVKKRLKGIPRTELESLQKVLARGWYHLISPIVLVYLMAVVQYSPMHSALWAIIVASVTGFIIRSLDLNSFIKAIAEGGTGVVLVAAATAAAGIVIGQVNLSGLGLKLSSLIVDLSGGNLPLLLLLTMLTSIVLGMGLPTTACYLVLAILVAPALIRMGVDQLAAHMFIFYYGTLSVITPPVAIAAYAGSALAGSDPMKTGFVAWRLALPGFIVPFMFVYSPLLLGYGTPLEMVWGGLTAFLGAAMIGCAIQGQLLTMANVLERALLLAAGILLIDPGLVTDTIALAVLGLVAGRQYYLRRKAIPQAESVERF